MFGKCGVFPCSSSLNKNIASWAHPACTSGFPEHLDDKADRNCLRSQRNPWILMGRLVSFSDYTSTKFIQIQIQQFHVCKNAQHSEAWADFTWGKPCYIYVHPISSHPMNWVTWPICSRLCRRPSNFTCVFHSLPPFSSWQNATTKEPHGDKGTNNSCRIWDGV